MSCTPISMLCACDNVRIHSCAYAIAIITSIICRVLVGSWVIHCDCALLEVCLVATYFLWKKNTKISDLFQTTLLFLCDSHRFKHNLPCLGMKRGYSLQLCHIGSLLGYETLSVPKTKTTKIIDVIFLEIHVYHCTSSCPSIQKLLVESQD